MMREDPVFYKWINLGGVFAYMYRFGIMMAGCIFFFLQGKRYLSIHNRWLSKLGRRTLGIYAFQFIILHHLGVILTIENFYVKILIQTAVCVMICYYLTVGISKVKYVRTIMIGES